MESAVASALTTVFSPLHLAVLAGAVVAGLVFGAVPGLGGIVGLALLLPFTYSWEPSLAITAMIGLVSVVSTGDTIPAVLFGVPGTSAAQATIMDGHPLAKLGQADRALAAAFLASILGGIFGAVVLGLSIPVMRPLVLAFGSPEYFMVGLWGITMVSALSSGSVVKGLLSALVGLLLASIGPAPQAAYERWTFGSLYLYEGVPLVPLALGLFAIPEMVDLYVRGTRLTGSVQLPRRLGAIVRQALRDVKDHWFLIIRSGLIGTWVGAIPGLGSSLVDWLAYGHALASERKAAQTFGKGDIRGVIAPESANNAIHGGALIPTLAFGIPGSPVMAIFLGALLYHNITPGLNMLTTQLDLTLVMLWTLPVANIMGGLLCLLLTRQFTRITALAAHQLVPAVLVVAMFAAYENSRSLGDLSALLLFSILGWLMKSSGWPRPPLILAFVLSPIIEENLIISMQRFGMAWVSRPAVLVLAALTVGSLVWGIRSARTSQHRGDDV